MSSVVQFEQPTSEYVGISSTDSDKVPDIVCHLSYRERITMQPCAAELALISGLLPELLEHIFSDVSFESER